jgi:uncharacterized damage-inducible protein DinB
VGAWAEELADRFVRANEELIALAEGCSEAQWRARCDAEGWPVGVVVHHVADDYAALLAVIEAVAVGGPAPVVTRKELAGRNAEHARRFAACTREETVALLRRNGAAVARVIRGLDDDQLRRTGEVLGRETSVAQLVETVLLAHVRGHMASIRATVSRVR